MRPRFLIFFFAALCLALAGFDDSKTAKAADELTKELSSQLATLVGAPFDVGYDNDTDPAGEAELLDFNSQLIEPVELDSAWDFSAIDTSGQPPADDVFGADAPVMTAASNPPISAHPSATRPTVTPKERQVFDPLTDHFWPVAKNDGAAEVSVTFSEPLRVDETADDGSLSADAALIDEEEPEVPIGPKNFRISDSVKIKAQPLGGGLGGRVTFTFMLPTGAERE